MVTVRVQRITSVNDPETGKLGKQIELVEVRERGGQPFFSGVVGEDEARLVRGIVGQFQSLGIFPQVREIVIPKITIFLTESECDLMGVDFDVNDIFELGIRNGSITFTKRLEGV